MTCASERALVRRPRPPPEVAARWYLPPFRISYAAPALHSCRRAIGHHTALDGKYTLPNIERARSSAMH